jgi:Sulfotransferase family
MLISNQHNFIFIHIYKNAGTSITKALLPFAASKLQLKVSRILKGLHISNKSTAQPFSTHIKASEIIETLGKEKFDSFFSFAIVRNPWDWQVSLYNFMLKNSNHHQHDLVKSLGNFDEYIMWRCDREVKFQKDFIYSVDGELLINFVGRYETLDADFTTLCSRIGISTSLPKLNISNTKPYQQFYTKETKELVERTFDVDIKLFGYNF